MRDMCESGSGTDDGINRKRHQQATSWSHRTQSVKSLGHGFFSFADSSRETSQLAAARLVASSAAGSENCRAVLFTRGSEH